MRPIPIRLLPAPDLSERPRGIHCSELIRRIMVKLEPKKFQKSDGSFDDDALLRFEIGFAFEQVVLSRAFMMRLPILGKRKHLATQLSIKFRGVWLTPDVFNWWRGVLYECKTTKYSMGTPIDDMKFWHWWVQIQAYCLALGVRRAVLIVCFLNGDYRKVRFKTCAWKVRFTRRELEENWAMLENERRELLRERRRVA